jgi:hypothetical protein
MENMKQKTIKILFLFFLNTLSFSNNLFATLATEQPRKIQSNDDTFIKNFVQDIESNKISYNGKTLILYADPGSNTNGTFYLTFAVCSIFGLACLGCNNKEVRVGGGLLALLCDSLCAICLLKNLYYDIEKIPFITITNEEIKIWNDESINWRNVCRIKNETIRTKNDGVTISKESIVHLCDKYLNSLFTIKDGKYLPISIDNLVAILEHYIEKNKQKNKF